VLTVEEFQNLLQHVDEEPFRTMLLTACASAFVVASSWV